MKTTNGDRQPYSGHVPRCRDCINFDSGQCSCPCGERRVGISDLCACGHFSIREGQRS